MKNSESLCYFRLFIVSVLSLFLEMALIRWIGTEVRIFAYLQNMILIVCFVGLGMGCYQAKDCSTPRQQTVPLALLVFLLSFPLSRKVFAGISYYLLSLSDPYNFILQKDFAPDLRSLGSVAVGLVLILVILSLVWNVFLPLGNTLGLLMDRAASPIKAYSVNIFGSLAGVVLFSVCSLFRWPPFIWFLMTGTLIVLLNGRGFRRDAVSWALLAVVILSTLIMPGEPGVQRVVWSPYQKLTISKAEIPEAYSVYTNNLPFTGTNNFSTDYTSKHPVFFDPADAGYYQYDLPYRFQPAAADILIIGSGAGNDIAGALRNTTAKITAVEIDPAIIQLGKELHPERPYHSSRVTIVNNDARAYFNATKKKFDLVVFGALDSHTMSGLTDTRLDHYVYTRESFAKVKTLLKQDGILFMSFHATNDFLIDRLTGLLRGTFNRDPIVFMLPQGGYTAGTMMFVSGDIAQAEKAISSDVKLAQVIERGQQAVTPMFGRPVADLPALHTEITTDDWPFLYLPRRQLPYLHLVVVALVLALFLWKSRRSEKASIFFRWDATHWHFFFLGAAFLLLEVHNINRACVILGNTWTISALIVSSILIMALLANLFYSLLSSKVSGPAYAMLLAAIAALYFSSLSVFAGLPAVPRFLLIGLSTTVPMFFSGLIFIESFSGVPQRSSVLAVNLLGSLFGGVMQVLSYRWGIGALLILVLILYSFSALLRPKHHLTP